VVVTSKENNVRIAVVGSGVAGLACARWLNVDHDVVLFESAPDFGGHAHTITVEVDGQQHAVDTGFMVYNERNYPLLTQLLDELGVRTRPSDMSFAMSDSADDVEWCGSGLLSVFAQSRNVLRPTFWRMLIDVVRFNRAAHTLIRSDAPNDETLEDFIGRGSYGRSFLEWYLVPMGAAIWSADPTTFLRFPAAAFARFFDNHGLLQLSRRTQWRTIIGGSISYVTRIIEALGDDARRGTAVRRVVRHSDGVHVVTDEGSEVFDHVVLACHSDDALALLDAPTSAEVDVLTAIRYRDNEAVVHTDERALPRRPRARASWNWRRRVGSTDPTLTYDLTRLQGLDTRRPLLLTLNDSSSIDPSRILARLHFRHPVFDVAALEAQQRHDEISGIDRVSFAGAYWGYGFHEDGVRSARRVCDSLGVGGRVSA
jgi:uncharacterized protein